MLLVDLFLLWDRISLVRSLLEFPCKPSPQNVFIRTALHLLTQAVGALDLATAGPLAKLYSKV